MLVNDIKDKLGKLHRLAKDQAAPVTESSFPTRRLILVVLFAVVILGGLAYLAFVNRHRFQFPSRQADTQPSIETTEPSTVEPLSEEQLLAFTIQDLRNADDWVVLETLDRLPEFARENAWQIVDPLIDALARENPEVRRRTIVLLGRLDAFAFDALPQLIRLAESDDQYAAAATVAILRIHWESIYEVSRDPVPRLTQMLGLRDEAVRENALAALVCLGADARPAIPAIVRMLKSTEQRIGRSPRVSAAWALASLAENARDSLTEQEQAAMTEALVEAAAETNRTDCYYVQRYAIWGLVQLGPPADAVPSLVAVAGKRSSHPVQIGTLEHLARFGLLRDSKVRDGALPQRPAEPKVEMDELLQLVDEPPHDVRHLDAWDNAERVAAVLALGRCGSEAKVALPHLRRLLTDGDLYLRIVAASAIGQIEGTEQAIRQLLDDPALPRKQESTPMRKADGALQAAAPPGAEAVQAAIEEVRELENQWAADHERRIAALESLGMAGGSVTGPLLEVMNEHRDAEVAVAAAAALWRIRRSKVALIKLIRMMRWPRWAYAATPILAEIGPEARMATVELLDFAPEDNLEALTALISVAPDPRVTTWRLADAMYSEDEQTQHFAYRTLLELLLADPQVLRFTED